MTTTKFKIDVQDWTKIPIDNAKFILDEAKAYVNYLVYASDKITNRAFAMLVILIPIISALIAFTINEKMKPVLSDKLVIYMLLFVIMALISIMFCLSKIVFPRKFMPSGREPRQICTKEFLAVNFDLELSKLAIVLNEIEASQIKIDYNEKQNSDRTLFLEKIMLSLGLLFAAAAIFIIVYYII